MAELHPRLLTPGFGVSDRTIRARQKIADGYLPDAREVFAAAQLAKAEQEAQNG